MVLDAASLGEWESCRRKYLLSQAWRPLRWRPKALYDACLRSALISIVQDHLPAAAAAADARAAFLQSAANPGLDITTDPYLAARDWCAMLDTTLRALARAGLPPQLKVAPPVRLNSRVEWAPLAQFDGQSLHRWLTIDHWSESNLARELHSWRVMGDVAITKLPMVVHVVEIGQVRNGRRASPWVRGWKHPTMPSLPMRFKGKLPGAFKNWKPIYMDEARVDAYAWVEQMEAEGITKDLIHQISVKVPSDAQCAMVVRDVLSETIRIQEVTEERTPWDALPMSRNACDFPLPCPFQYVCYGDGLVQIENLGIYQARIAEKTRPLPSSEHQAEQVPARSAS